MPSISIEDAQATLPKLIETLQPGERLDIARNGALVATLTRTARSSWPCQPGSAAHRSIWMAPDFDAPLDDFREFME